MNAIRCPGCKTVNPLSSVACKECGFPLSNLPSDAQVSVPVQDIYEAQNSASGAPIAQDNEIGRKTFFWYRVYCGVLIALYFLTTIGGIVLAYYQPATSEYKAEEMLVMGILYAVVGAVFFLVFVVAIFLPPKPYNWIVGIVMIALGMTSCCFLPFVIPLLIYWLKPETKAYFGRK